MSDGPTQSKAALPWLTLSTTLLIVLKATGVAEMPWWVAFSPVLAPLALLGMSLSVMVISLLAAALLSLLVGSSGTKRAMSDAPPARHDRGEWDAKAPRTVNSKRDGTIH